MRLLPTGVLFITEDGNVAVANARAVALLGSDPVGQPSSRFFAPVETLRDDVEEEGASRQERRIELGSGARDLGYHVLRVNEGDLRGYAVVFQDITDAQRLRAERDRLLQLAAVGDVLPTLLHELKNPLAAVRAAVEVLIEEHADTPVATELHAVLNEIRRMGITLDGVGRLKNDLRTRRPAPIDQACFEAFTVLKPQAKAKGVTLHADVAPLPLLPFDAGAFRAMVFNLALNAIHASKSGGTIDLVVRLLDGQLCLSVNDTGQGMSPEVLARCRELFFTTKARGSGIGLALVQSLVDSAHGTLEIDSAQDRGTMITLKVPIADPNAAPEGSHVTNR